MSVAKRKQQNLPELAERDYRLFLALLDSRYMTLRQIADLFFEGSDAAARQRFSIRLVRDGYIKPRTIPNYRFSFYTLNRPGLDALAQVGLLPQVQFDWKHFDDRLGLRPLTIAHEGQVVDLRVALELACTAHPDYVLEEFISWPRRMQFSAPHPKTNEMEDVKPDAFVTIAESAPPYRRHHFFIEHDRGTEVLETLMTKARGYLYFHTSDHDGFHRRITGDRYDKASGAPRVPLNAVFVLLSVDRRNNIAAQLRLLQTPIKNVVRLTTLAEFTADPFGAHYITPLEYEECLRGTPYDILEQTPSRSSARDGLVEGRIRKHRLVV